jgi:hypothetical protein
MLSQNYTKIPTHTCENGNHQENKQKQILARMQEKRNPHTLVVEMYIGATTMEISMEIPQKPKNKLILCPHHSILGYISQGV